MPRARRQRCPSAWSQGPQGSPLDPDPLAPGSIPCIACADAPRGTGRPHPAAGYHTYNTAPETRARGAIRLTTWAPRRSGSRPPDCRPLQPRCASDGWNEYKASCTHCDLRQAHKRLSGMTHMSTASNSGPLSTEGQSNGTPPSAVGGGRQEFVHYRKASSLGHQRGHFQCS